MRRIAVFAAVVVTLPGSVGVAQVLEVSGGASSLYQAQGASVALRTPTGAMSVGAGFSQGRFVAGGTVQRRTGALLLTTGMQEMVLDVPTDGVSGHRFRAVGVGLRNGQSADGRTDRSTWQVFAGSSSQWLNTPLFAGVRPEGVAVAAVVRHAFGPSLELSSQTVYAERWTALGSLLWTMSRAVRLAGTAGVSGGARYAAASVTVEEPLFDVLGSYVAAPATFQRAGLASDLMAEPVGTNLDVTLRSSQNPRYTAEVAHHSYLNPVVGGGPAAVSSVDDVAAHAHLRQVGLGGSVIRSTYQGMQTGAMALTGSYVPASRWSVQGQYLQSTMLNGASTGETGRTWIATVTREMSSRLRLSGVLTRSMGKSNATMEGALLTNRVSLSANVQTFYNPANPAHPFQQTLVFSTEVTLFGRLRLLASSFVAGNGKVNYTTEAHAIAARGMSVARPVAEATFGEYLLHGRVLGLDRAPVSGAAVAVDGAVVFTDSEGHFFVREKRKKMHHVRLLPEQFLDGYRYRVVSQPAVLESQRLSPVELKRHSEDKSQDPLFTVTRQDGSDGPADGGSAEEKKR